MKKKLLIKIFLAISIFVLGAGAGYFFSLKQKTVNKGLVNVQKDKYLAFLEEVYDKIQSNYWEKINDEQLSNIFKLGIEKLSGESQQLKPNNKIGLQKLLKEIIQRIESEEQKKEFTAQLADIVLANLKPFGRSRLYSKKEEKALKNNIENINPEVNQYERLGVNKNASQKEIEKNYQEKSVELEAKKEVFLTPEQRSEIEKKVAEVKYAHRILSDDNSKKIYDKTGIEPTVDYRFIRPDIFYVHIKKISPTTLDEFKKAVEEVNNVNGLDSLILDLQNNIGGAIDTLPYFLGPFIGQDQYAYQFFKQGEKIDFKTKTGWLSSLIRYKKVVILINGHTQSSAEIIAAVLKKYNVGITVGTATKGWGTIERVFPMENQIDPKEKFSIFLVHSLTLREDSEPIEGKGVEPLINIKDSNWKQQLYAYFHYHELEEAVQETLVP